MLVFALDAGLGLVMVFAVVVLSEVLVMLRRASVTALVSAGLRHGKNGRYA